MRYKADKVFFCNLGMSVTLSKITLIFYTFRLIHKRFKKTFINARGGGVTEATKRLLGQLPISAQSFSASPYLDLTHFSYDDKWVSVMERPKSCADHPIR